MSKEKAMNAYLKVCDWARKRYTKAGCLVLRQGEVLSPFSRVQALAWHKYGKDIMA